MSTMCCCKGLRPNIEGYGSSASTFFDPISLPLILLSSPHQQNQRRTCVFKIIVKSESLISKTIFHAASQSQIKLGYSRIWSKILSSSLTFVCSHLRPILSSFFADDVDKPQTPSSPANTATGGGDGHDPRSSQSVPPSSFNRRRRLNTKN